MTNELDNPKAVDSLWGLKDALAAEGRYIIPHNTHDTKVIEKIARLEDENRRIQNHLIHPLTSTDHMERHMSIVEKNKKEIARLKGLI